MSRACADAWNRGDLAGFLKPYSEHVIVVNPSGPVRGLKAFRANLISANTWGRNRTEKFAAIAHSEVQRLDANHVVQTALVVIRSPDSPDERHWTTSILRKTPHGWRVIHEQSF